MKDKTAAATPATAQASPAPNPCFGCGEANPAGMHLQFSLDEKKQRVVGRFPLGERYQGGQGIIHGGILALVLDEVLSKVSRLYDLRAVTAELNVEYLKPVRVDQVLHVEAHQERRDGRQLYHVGEIRDAAGRVLARARGRFVVVDPEKFRKTGRLSDDGNNGKD